MASPDVDLPSQVVISMISSSSSSSPSHYEEEDYDVLGFESRLSYGATLRHERVSELSVNCSALVFIICFFGSMFLMVGLYGPKTVSFGPNSSILVEPSSMFVEGIMVKEVNSSKPGLKLFGFSKSPTLDVFANWSESRVFSVSKNSYKGWPYYLNKGTTLNISYNIKPQGSAVQLVVNEGIQKVSQSLLEDPKYRDTYWSWNLIQGSGIIELDINKSSSYYLAVANLQRKNVEVELDINIRALLYDTKHSFYNCTFSTGECTFDDMSLVGSSVVVTSPAPSQGVSIEDEWHIMIAYQPRWVGYVIGTVMVICYTLVAINLWKSLQSGVGERNIRENDSERRGLLANKDEDGSTKGPCHDSLVDEDDELEETMRNEDKSTRGLCAICCNSPRDCFCLPCGHCVCCYKCGIKMEEADGTCPICRREMIVKRIYIA